MSKRCDVLIIDDEQVVLDAVGKVGKAHGYTVEGAAEGSTALRKLETEKFRLVICDIMMPDMDGFEILAAINTLHPETPVVMTTGYSTMEHAVRSLRNGAVAYLAKPFNEEELLSVIQLGLRSSSALKASPADASPSGTTSDTTYFLGRISWVRLEQAGSALVGITDTFLRMVGPPRRIHLCEEHEELVQGTPCARLMAQDGVSHDVLGPISGTIVEVNSGLVSNAREIERDPFGKGWLYRVIPTDTGYELKQLTPREAQTIPNADKT